MSKETKDALRSYRNQQLEKEANYFAMCLLMPADLVKREVEKLDVDLCEDDFLKKLSKTFGVSQNAMAVRLSQLKLLK